MDFGSEENRYIFSEIIVVMEVDLGMKTNEIYINPPIQMETAIE
jgi:hypothetical protein